MSDTLIYLFAIGKESIALGDDIFCLKIGSLTAYTTQVSSKEFGQQEFEANLKNIDWVKNKALLHQQLVDQVFKQVAIIPLKFGSVFSSIEQLKATIEPKTEHYIHLLNQIDGKSEWSLKLYYNKDKLESILEHSEAMQQLLVEMKNASPGKQFLLKKTLEKQKRELVKAEINRYRKIAFASFNSLMDQCKVKDNQSQELTGNPDQMILNAVGLLADNGSAYEMQEGFDKKHKFPEGIYSKFTGPWPPYNFLEA